ncbi:MAG: hypothetical protein ACRDPK_12535 [Carbonactinosporaceae bacterium]
MEFAVPDVRGGDYDRYARLFAPGLEKKLQADVKVMNEPGANGMTSLNNHQATPRDEPHLVLVHAVTALSAQIGDRDGVAYDLVDWPLARVVSEEPRVIVTAPDSGYRTWVEVVTSREGLRFATTGPYGPDFLVAALLQRALDRPLALTGDYRDAAEVIAAVRAGDAELGEVPTRVALPFILDGRLRPLTLLSFSDRVDEQPPAGVLLPHPAKKALTLPPPWMVAVTSGDRDEIAWRAQYAIAEMTDVGVYVAATPGTSIRCQNFLFNAFDDVAGNLVGGALDTYCTDQQLSRFNTCTNAYAPTGDRYRGLPPLEQPDGQGLLGIYNDIVEGPVEQAFKGIYSKPWSMHDGIFEQAH